MKTVCERPASNKAWKKNQLQRCRSVETAFWWIWTANKLTPFVCFCLIQLQWLEHQALPRLLKQVCAWLRRRGANIHLDAMHLYLRIHEEHAQQSLVIVHSLKKQSGLSLEFYWVVWGSPGCICLQDWSVSGKFYFFDWPSKVEGAGGLNVLGKTNPKNSYTWVL